MLIADLEISSRIASSAHGPLRILHVGNVAQNAYINASILRERGHDCDVIAFDWYHAASSPEWYDLAFSDIDDSVLGDNPYFPDFYALGRDMPRVGDWVAHGPIMSALRYLILRRRGDARAHAALASLNYLRFKATQMRTTVPLLEPMDEDAFRARLKTFDLDPATRRRILLGRAADRYYDWIRSRASTLAGCNFTRGWCAPLALGTLDQFFHADPVLAGVVRGLRAQGLAEAYGIEFEVRPPDHARFESSGFTADDIAPYAAVGPMLKELASHYDLCIFYGEACRYAYVAGIERYWALEHGTIRNLHSDASAQARLLGVAFQKAERVFLTNTDYATAGSRLELDLERRVYSPHPYDDARASAFRATYRRQRDPAHVVFLCPARQEWKASYVDSSMTKGNDLYFQAAHTLLMKGRTNFVLHCIDWGADCAESKKLVAELGLEAHVRWVSMLPKRKLWAAMLDADAVIDQFGLSAMGGIGFEALSLGVRLITRDDGVNNETFFEVSPPLLAAATVSQITVRMETVMDDPDDTANLGQEGTAWVSRHHSAERIIALQLYAYEDARAKLTNPASALATVATDRRNAIRQTG